MLLPEDEARERICPYDRTHSEQVVNCIGSDCMAWRWELLLLAEKDENALGYCGLAGKPE